MADHKWYTQGPFKGLPAETRCQLQSAGEEQRFPKRAILFREGEPAIFLFIVRSGWVRLMRKSDDSRVLTLDIVTPKDSLCGLSAFIGGRYVATGQAATPLDTVRLPAEVLKPLLQSHVGLAACLVQLLNQRYHHMAAAYAKAFAPVEQRIISVLLRLEEDFGSTLPVTRREVAELAGTTVETAIRVTNRMKWDQLLQLERGRIILLNHLGLVSREKTP